MILSPKSPLLFCRKREGIDRFLERLALLGRLDFLNFMDLNILVTIKKITLINMLGSIPHQKFCFYHLPTRGRAGIKIGDA